MTTETNCSFELGEGNGIDVAIYLIVGFMQRDQINQQPRKSDNFYRPSVVNAQTIIGREKLPDVGTNCTYPIDK